MNEVNKAVTKEQAKSLYDNLRGQLEATKENSIFIKPSEITNPATVSSNAASVINAAITKANTNGMHFVVVPAGEYWLTETVYLKSDVILKGCGMDATTLKIADNCDIDAIRVSAPTNNSGIMDLSIDGNRIQNYSTYANGHHGNAINVWLHYGRIERVRTNWVYKHSLLLNYDTGTGDDGLGFEPEHQNDMGNLNKVLWCDFRDSLLQGVMWGWRTMDSWMCYTNIGSHAANLYLEGGTSRFIGNHFDGDGDNGAGPEYNVYCGDGCRAMVFEDNIFENTQKENIFFRQPSYSNQTMTITIANNIIRTCSKSQNEQYANIKISGYSSSVPATEIVISGNQILNPDTNANHGYAGIHLLYCENSKITGNTFFNVGDDEVLLDNTCENVLDDGKMSEEVHSLKTEITNDGNVLGTLVMDDSVPSINLFDKTSSRNSSGQFYSLDGSLNTGVQSKYCTSHPIFVGAGTYKFTASYDTFGENTVAIPVLDTNGNVIGTNNGELTDSNATVTVTFTKPCIVKFNFLDSKINNIKFSLEDGYPSNYVSGKKQKASAICEANSALGEAKSILEAQLNMFNKDSTENLSGEYWRINGTHSTGQSAGLCLSHPIVIPAGTYKFHGSSTFGGNEGAVSVFDTSGAIIKVIPATVTSHVCEFTVERVSIVRFNYASANAESIVFCKSTLWDGAYHAYSKMIDRTFLHDVEKTDTTFFSRVKSINLLDMSNPIVGSYFKAADGTIVAYSNRVIKSAYIKLDGAGTYVTKVTKKLFGSNANKLALFDANKAYVKTITGTLGDDSNTYSVPATFTVADVDITDGAVYVGLSIENNYVGNTMFVKSSTYPAIYVPFYDYWRVSGLNVENGQAIEYDLNPLYGKTAVFDGDSICNGATDTSGNGSYAGRITTKNMMGNHNYAVSGGTLTAELYNDGGNARHWVSRTVDTMYADFPNADYIIFEGGTNDADLIGSILDSQNLPAKYGSFTANDFSGSYNDETFCGAVETIIYKAMSHWPHSKIGFVIAMKMGKTTETYNNRRAYFQTVMDICKKWGVPFINLWDECPMNPWLNSCYDGNMTIEENIEAHKLYKDGQHPTPDGYARITPIIEAWMKTL